MPFASDTTRSKLYQDGVNQRGLAQRGTFLLCNFAGRQRNVFVVVIEPLQLEKLWVRPLLPSSKDALSSSSSLRVLSFESPSSSLDSSSSSEIFEPEHYRKIQGLPKYSESLHKYAKRSLHSYANSAEPINERFFPYRC